MTQIQLETRNFQFYSEGMVSQEVLHEERQTLRLITPKVNMTTKCEHELGYCVAPLCFAKVASGIETKNKKKKGR